MSARHRHLIQRGLVALGASLLLDTPAMAGPPYATDDPEPTELGHWEIYTFTGIEGRDSNFNGSAGLDLNYGPVKDVQLTATLPIDYSHGTSGGWRSGAGDVEIGVKYRFANFPSEGISVAIFPRAFLPTSSASQRTRFLLPVWVQKDLGKTVIFGGGGVELNRGPGNRDFWLASAAVTHAFSDTITLGGEATHQSADAVGGASSNSVGLGAVAKLRAPFSLLISGGPAWSVGQASYHFYAALGLNF